ncbi:MAG: hypothetical protein JSS67_01210 [Bacteroidetes bacterium]|nr:hypothetical protein [Bacteroidota bacterium]
MKNFFLMLLLLGSTSVFSQETFDTIPPYQKDSTFPHFMLLQTDSTWFLENQLPRDKPVVIIYFSPTCGHCQLTANEFKRQSQDLQNIFFVWASYSPMDEIKTFAQNFDLLYHPNIRIGRDPNYIIPAYFRVKYTPFIAVYNLHGKIIKTFEFGTDPETIIDILKQIL